MLKVITILCLFMAFDSMKQTRLKRLKRATNQRIEHWPNGVVPFVISNAYTEGEKALLTVSMRRWEERTCVRFVPHTADLSRTLGHVGYIRFRKLSSCFSHIGWKRDLQPQSLGLGSGCLGLRTIIHELGHCLGLIHEMERADRDYYLTVLEENVNPESRRNFQKVTETGTEYDTFGTPYDYKSIMHYSPTEWTRDGHIGLLSKDQAYQNSLGKSSEISFYDVQRINMAYNCSNNCSVSFGCEHGGYIGGMDCTCQCPDGFVGDFCEITLPGSEYIIDWSCQTGYEYSHGKCYLFVYNQPMTFSNAMAYCTSRSATLAAFKYRWEQKWLMNRIAEKDRLRPKTNLYWLAISRRASVEGYANYMLYDNTTYDESLMLIKETVPTNVDACVASDGEKLISFRCTQLPGVDTVCMKDFDHRCGGRIRVRKKPRYVQSPGYPDEYPPDVHCLYFLQTRKNKKIEITFESFLMDKECNQDYLELRIGLNLTLPGQRYCLSELEGKRFITQTNAAMLVFKTDSLFGRSGFRAKIQSVSTKGFPSTNVENWAPSPMGSYFQYSNITISEPYFENVWRVFKSLVVSKIF